MFGLLVCLLSLMVTLSAYAKQTICLNMIVKNETKVIKRCLDSVKPLIDYWVIVDTGSHDGTQKMIKKELKGIPGVLYERKWRNWGENRSEAFELAKNKADYILFMDADDVLEFDAEPSLPFLTHDQYIMWRGTKDFQYLKPQIVKADLPWQWKGVTHEYLDCSQIYTSQILTGVKYVTKDGGASSFDPEKFTKNVKLLEEGLKKEPDNQRYVFYLAESYRDAGDKAQALKWYQQRVNMQGWDEEVFWSLLQIAHMLRELGLADNLIIEAYKNAHAFRPHRIEPIYYLAELLNQQNQYMQAYACIKMWEQLPKPQQKDALFNMDWMEKYGLAFQLSICSYYAGHYQESLEVCDKLLKIEDLPSHWRELTEINRTFPTAKLQEVICKK